MPSERVRRGLPETHVSIVYFESSTWVHVRSGRRLGGHWVPDSRVDHRLGAVDLDVALSEQYATALAMLGRVLEKEHQTPP